MKHAIYVRVSTEDQAEKGTIENQIEFARKYCDLHRLEIFKFYKDDGFSGTIPLLNRPAAAEMMEDAKNGLFNVLLVYKLDRLGRSARVTLNSIYDLEAMDIQIKSMTEPFDTTSPSGRFMITMLAGVADLERETILERMWHGANRAAREGRWLGGIVPYGYYVDENKYLKISETLLPNCSFSEADVIRLIYKMSAEGNSTVKIADYLNSLRIPPSYTKDNRTIKKGKRKTNTAGIWRPGRIQNMLKNKTYMGTHQYGKRATVERELIEREVPAIVSKDLFNASMETMKRLKFETGNKKHEYLLSGLIKCGLCKSNYIGTHYGKYINSNREKKYYQCYGKSYYAGTQVGKCKAKNIVVDDLDSFVWNDCINFINNPGKAIEKLKEKKSTLEKNSLSISSEIENLKKEISNKESEKQSILDLFRKGMINSVDVEKQLSSIKEETTRLSGYLYDLEKKLNIEEVSKAKQDSIFALLSTLKGKIKNPSYEDKKEIVNLLVSSIVIETDVGDNPFKSTANIVINYSFGNVESCGYYPQGHACKN